MQFGRKLATVVLTGSMVIGGLVGSVGDAEASPKKEDQSSSTKKVGPKKSNSKAKMTAVYAAKR